MIGDDYKTGYAAKFRVPLRDKYGALQTGMSATVSIYQPDDTAEATPPAVSELGTSGIYEFSYTPAAEGAYSFKVEATGCLAVVWTIQVRARNRDDLAAPSDVLVDPATDRIDGSLVDAAVSSRAATGAAMALTSDERAAVASAVLDEPVQSAGATDDSLRAAAKAAWAQGFGRWTLVGTTLTLYGPDGQTTVRTFTLDSADAPTERVPA